MYRILFVLCCFLLSEGSARAQKTAAYYWAQVPAYPAQPTKAAFGKFLNDIEKLIKSIEAEAERQDAVAEARPATGPHIFYQNTRNLSQAENLALMKRAQERADLLAAIGNQKAPYIQRSASLQQTYKRELEAGRTAVMQKWFLAGSSPIKAYLAAYAGVLKSVEPKLVKLWEDGYEDKGVNVKGLPCPETIRQVTEYLWELHSLFHLAIDDNLLKP
ncbi:hypothetical protein [Flaviaesturariibacter amylovorans]|uniref:Uncharacterized protein n=1 Tax=Flaviaesturariibacter amylovorans TaxID=1084520 RepID=A0ABP8GNU3_9BACT